MKNLRWLLAAGVAMLSLAAAAAAQPFPSRPIRLVVPFPPGTASDFLGRTLGQALTELYKVQVVVDNRPGAGGLVGTPIVLGATPDGHTIGLFGSPYLTSPMLQRKPPYEPLKDGVPVVQIAGIPNVVGVSNHLPVKTLPEFIAYARARPGQLNYASVGVGSIAHFGAEIVARAAGLQAVHVPYKILADGWSDLFSGRTHFFVFAAPAAVPMVKEGRVRALAVTTPSRIPALPEVPTVAEAGLPAAEHTAWFGIFAPAGTPRALVSRLARDISAVVREPQTRQRFLTQGAEPVGDSSPEAFMKLLRAENARFARLVKEAGMQLQ
ncbi:MAG TPA: tripartite tricarboxylate transporter substrate binding protein [Burkholderiales bacterium]|nr:tripartite tricarboxylate transporter substrate binding protein [Burkholderiales bacterium]